MDKIQKQFYKPIAMNSIKTFNIFLLILGLNCLIFAQKSWIPHPTVPTQNKLYSVTNFKMATYYQTACIAVGDSGTILIANDGKNWLNQITGIRNSLFGVLNGGLVCVGDKGIITSGSFNGASFSGLESGTKKTLKAVTCASSNLIPTFVIVGDSGIILTSPNDTVWTPQISGTTKNLNAIFYASYSLGPFIAVGDSGIVLTSSDGIVWTKQNSGTNKNLHAISGGSYHSGCVIAAGDSGIIISSEKSQAGITWQAQNSGTLNNLFGIHCIFDELAGRYIYFLIVGAHGTILSAQDSVTLWKSENSGTNKDLHGATSTKDSLIVVGDSGTILTSKLPDFPMGSKIILSEKSSRSVFIGSDKYTLPSKAFISINVYDLKGRLAKTIVNQMQEAGVHKFNWPSTFSHGAYILSLNAGGQKVNKLIMVGK